MKNIYIVASPFQLIGAIEAKNRFKGDEDTIVIFLSENGLQNTFLKSIAQMFLGQGQIYVTYKNKLSSLYNRMRLLRELKDRSFDNAFIGQYNEFSMQLYMCNLTYKNLFLVDDGTATLVFTNMITEVITHVNCIKDGVLKGLTTRLLIKKHKLKQQREVKINWFTMFNFTPQNKGLFVRHQFEYLKQRYINTGQPINAGNDVIYFIGSDLVRNGIIKTNKIYNELIKKIRAHYSQFQFIYLPHRNEDLNDLSPLTATTDIKVVQFENVLEIAFIANNIVPRQICSFYSTALYSLKLLYPQCTIDFMELDKAYINDDYIEFVTQIEDYYRKLFNSIL